MPPRKELCRNFQRGSCQYGDRCRFLHATQQQSKPNPFAFGMQSGTSFQHTNPQQQRPNPFGFGIQNGRGGNNFGSKPNQFKPFENKWTLSSTNNTRSPSDPRQSNNQRSAADHTCTDSESCKRIIVEDHQNEEPQWKLTCYGHYKYGPCDIVGDISFEELRALAYDDAKHGKSLQFIIERERSLLNSKLVEFQNLLQKPYTVSSAATPGTQNLFGGGSASAPIVNSGEFQNVLQKPSTVSSVATPGTQNLFGGGSASAPVVNNGVSAPASSFSQLNASLNTRPSAAPNYSFGQSSAFQNHSQPSGMFQMNNSPFNTSGAFGSQPPHQSIQSSFSFGPASVGNNSMSAHKNPFSTIANSSQTRNASDIFNFSSDGSNSASSAIGQSSISIQSVPKEKNANGDDSIWSKPEWKWNVGEIPEDAPEDIYIRNW